MGCGLGGPLTKAMAAEDAKNDPTQAVVLAILREAQQLGLPPLLRTAIHKFVYLVDLYVAEETQGKTHTGTRWLFLNFGPFAPALASSLEQLVGRGDVFLDQGQSSTEAEYRTYTIRRGLGAPLRDIGVPGRVALRIAADLKRYARDLPALLDYVYFHTAPMANALPGCVLDFSACMPTDFTAFKPVAMRTIPSKRLKDARAKLRELAKKRDEDRQRYAVGPYDETYYAGMAALEDESLPAGLSGEARIRVE